MSVTNRRCMHGHSLVPLGGSVYACLARDTSSISNVWEDKGGYLVSPPSYYAVLAMGQALVDQKRVHFAADAPCDYCSDRHTYEPCAVCEHTHVHERCKVCHCCCYVTAADASEPEAARD